MKTDRLHRLRADFPEGTAEGRYCERVVQLLNEISMPQELAWGLAVMLLLELAEVTLSSGEPLENPVAYIPNKLSIASIAACYFQDVSADPYWWREKYNSDELEHEVNVAARKLAARLEALDAVAEVRGI